MERNSVGQKGRSEGESQLARFDFYAATASRYYAPVALGIWVANWEIGCEALGIRGHVALLSAGELRVHDAEARAQLPKYDVSWVLDDTVNGSV